jgi:hypothetical protein
MLDELIAPIGPEVRLGVADIDDEEHGAKYGGWSVRTGPCLESQAAT